MHGSNNGDTYFNAFDIDTSGNIVAGGGTLGNDTVSNTTLPNPYVAFINADSSFPWSKQFTPTHDYVDFVKFNPGYSKILIILDYQITLPTILIILDTSGNQLN